MGLVSTTRSNSKTMPINDNDYSCHTYNSCGACLTNCMGYISRHCLLMATGLASIHTTYTVLRTRHKRPVHTLFLNLKKRTINSSNLDWNPRFSIRHSIILPPKPPAQLLTFCTFQYLYTALELKPSLTLTLTLWPKAT